MKCKIENNHLMIYYENGELKEDATENQNECFYCKHNPKTCGSDKTQYNGQFCDLMVCCYEEKED